MRMIKTTRVFRPFSIGKTGNCRRFVSCRLPFLLLAAILSMSACDQTDSRQSAKIDDRDASIAELHNLGWLGADAQPLNATLTMPDPENPDASVTPGGIVIVKVLGGWPLDAAQLKAGDVIVRVADDWLPIKEDPTLDLIKAVEDQINAGRKEIEVGYYRDGKFAKALIQTELESLDHGLPRPVARMVDLSTATLKHLARLQTDDGSFAVAADNVDAKLIATSMSGLAFLSADPSASNEFEQSVAGCLKYIGEQLDRFASDSEAAGLDPLTASHVALFLSESDIQLMDEDWLERLGVVLDSFATHQHESGGWNVSELDYTDVDSDAEPSEPSVDILATFTTNQVLLALGVLERKGMTIDNAMIERAMTWLNEQSRLRVPSTVDRRVKALLSAGTAAALSALNCDRNDLLLKEHLAGALDRAHDVLTAPQLGLPGLVSIAIAARQAGNESWLQFHESVKHLAVSLPRPDGSVSDYPNVKRDPLDFELRVAGESWTTAHIGLLISMQSQSLEKLMAIETPDSMIVRDSTGKKSDGSAGMPVLKLDGANTADAEALKKMIMDQLKEQGMDVDESKLEIKTVEKTDDD